MNRVLLGLLLSCLTACANEKLGDLPEDTVAASTGGLGSSGDESSSGGSESSTTGGPTTDGSTSTETTGGAAQAGEVGARCATPTACGAGLDCKTDFFGERPVCTVGCADMECPRGTECVEGISDYNGELTAPSCMRPCQGAEDCLALGSECDVALGVEGRDSLGEDALFCF